MRRALAFVSLGLTVAVALAASSCSSGSSRTLVAEFANVGDLVSRANVQQSDAVVGTVSKIELVQDKSDWLARVTMTLKPEGEMTRITWDYVVGGYMRTPAAQMAPIVDQVVGEQLLRLAAKLGTVMDPASRRAP